MYPAWICEGCKAATKNSTNIWTCPGCGKDTCDSCFDMFGHCKACCVGKTKEELRDAANEKGFDFELFPERE